MNVPNLIEQVVDLVRTNEGYTGGKPYYFYGWPVEINKELFARKSTGKYPAIFLRLPFTASKVRELTTLTLNLAIVDFTNKGYFTAQRYDNVIDPVISPLYSQLFKWIKASGLFINTGTPDHDWKDMLYYSSDKDKKDKSAFSDPLDAREITNLKLTTRLNIC